MREAINQKQIEEICAGVETASSALGVQVGGDHYKGFVIQPVEFTMRNRLSFLQGCVVKRICRYNLPGGKGIEDLDKIKHELDLIADLEGLKRK